MGNNSKPILQWHPAFYAGIQIEFEAERDKLIFENEHQLGTKPKQIDVLIIKKNSDEPIHKNIGRIFRKHNIIEYKSPTDYLSIDDFYLVYGYACLYKADSATANTIPVNEITLSFVCHKFPQEVIKHLNSIRKYTIEKQEDGVYYVKGDFFPIQIIHTKKLSKNTNLWLRNLTDTLKNKDDILTLMTEYSTKMENKLYSSVMEIIAQANEKKFEEVGIVCDTLKRIILEQNREAYEQEKQEAINAAIAERDAALAEKQARIAELEAQLAAKENA